MMAHEFLYRMDVLCLSKRGYTLIEIIVTVSIITAFSLIFITRFKYRTRDNLRPIHYCQLEAMATQSQCIYIADLWFNRNGNINHGQSQRIGEKNCVFWLGFGRYQCEE